MDPELLDRALLELASGEPEWVMVDRRVLRILMGPLADLIVQAPMNLSRNLPSGEEPFIWDADEFCGG